jgi:hypothetical protein
MVFFFSAKLTKEEVKAIASRFQQLQKLVINNCSNIQPVDLKDFKPSNFECVIENVLFGEDNDELSDCVCLSLCVLVWGCL